MGKFVNIGNKNVIINYETFFDIILQNENVSDSYRIRNIDIFLKFIYLNSCQLQQLRFYLHPLQE